jgi:GT2 family glycosyltransferase
MGFSREVFQVTGGFSTLQVAEDIELSVRIEKAGFKTALVEDAFVFHKRKSSFAKFLKQLTMHGRGRVDLNLRHPGQIKAVHWLPSIFLAVCILIPILYFIQNTIGLAVLALMIGYLCLLWIAASVYYRHLYIGLLSVWASLLMLLGYGYGLASQYVFRVLLGRGRDTHKAEILKL